ncbi:hypothetical protein B7H23_14640 [Notoacmeibacter marinus]|uniref:Glycosyl transferase n=1 Tax=Notoacmeibacter marinus TaxID=1876515 RepID=A0A231UVP0_9HYPH|nr:glycosyltransferase family 4 protein [Notoacmeibacter marinus]OXS99395.1 hypothetical protein B7H23_14640 [Notoacmeibacter marinus]
MNILHITSVHARNDTRIFNKMCQSLAADGAEVTLIMADGLGDAVVGGVEIVDVGGSGTRVDRMIRAVRRVAGAAATRSPDIIHFHDPEFIQMIPALRKTGAKIVMDAHEDVEKQIFSKPYLHPATRKLVSLAYSLVERRMIRHVDLVIGATPAISAKFEGQGLRTATVNNFPILGELAVPDIDWTLKQPVACYVGGMSAIRGASQVGQAAALLEPPITIEFAGGFAPPELGETVATLGGDRIKRLGHLDREQVRDLMARSMAGIVTFLPAPNHMDAQPNKMFEYMSAGLPVIASDFPLWRQIIAEADCGILVDPMDPKAIADAINALVNDPERAERLGRNGQRAVRERYNWASEFATLQNAYERLIAA